MSSDYVSDEMISELRICTEEAFDRYFQYGNYVGDISNHLIMEVVNSITQPEKYREILRPFYYTSKLRRILEFVRYNVSFIVDKKGSLSDIVTLILDCSDFLKEDEETRFGSPVRFYATNVIQDLLRDVRPDVRANIMNTALSKTKAVLGFIMTIAILQDEMKKKPEKEKFFPELRFQEFEGELQDRGLKWIGSDECLDHPEFRSLIRVLKDRISTNEFDSTFLVLLGRDIGNYKKLLRNYVTDRGPIEYGKVAGKQKLEFDFESLDRIFDLAKLQKKYTGILITFEAGESEMYKVAWDLFTDGVGNYLYERRTKTDSEKRD